MVPLSWSCVDALLLGRDDVAGEHRQHRAVHRHRHRHLVERDAVEEDLHVLDRVDRDAGLADVADDARVVAVVAAVGGEVERDRQAHLPGREVARGRRRSTPRRWRSRRTGGSSTAGSRTSSPAARARTARSPGSVADGLEALEVGRGVERLDVDALGRVPGQRVGVALELLRRPGPPSRTRVGTFAVTHARKGTTAFRAGRSRRLSWPGRAFGARGRPVRGRPARGLLERPAGLGDAGRPTGGCRRRAASRPSEAARRPERAVSARARAGAGCGRSGPGVGALDESPCTRVVQ